MTYPGRALCQYPVDAGDRDDFPAGWKIFLAKMRVRGRIERVPASCRVKRDNV